ncbi:MAG: DUF2500 domain-containing protein [Ruminococcaceae bacterium]|nr:DUF2500 domain-containing protein [Oscillospiraceae bacterium]
MKLHLMFIVPAVFAVFFIVVVIISLKNMTKMKNFNGFPTGFVPGGQDLPLESGMAKVLSKRRARRGSNGGTSYYVTFAIGEEVKEIRVFSPTFYSISEGDEGMLYYKGYMLVDFKKNA